MNRIRHSIAILLIAVLTLTGHSMAIARGMPAATGMMELCTGTSPVMVPVDANGQPTGPAHICPEFTLMLSEAISAEVDVVRVDQGYVLLARDRRRPVIRHTTLPRQLARAPPFVVENTF